MVEEFRVAKEAADRAEAEFEGPRTGGDPRDSWGSVFAASEQEPAQYFSAFHAHFTGQELMGAGDLLEQAGDELREVQAWGEEDVERVREALCDALPDMNLAIRNKKVSRRNLSPEKAVQAYIAILNIYRPVRSARPRGSVVRLRACTTTTSMARCRSVPDPHRLRLV